MKRLEIEPNLDEIKAELSRRRFLDFVLYTFPNYIVNWHHELVIKKLQAFYDGDIKYLMVLMPPQHGKSELASIRFPAWVLGKDPNRKVAGISYNLVKARGFNTKARRVIESDEYQRIFPQTKLKGMTEDKRSSMYSKSMSLMEVVNYDGFYLSVGIRGGLTGEPVDLLILDDTVKDRAEALSHATQKRNNEWFDAVARTRLPDSGQVLAVNTRWAVNDIPGKLLREMREGTGFDFEILKLPALKEENGCPEDPRQTGEALWPEKHSREKLEARAKINPSVAQAVDQQNPHTPKELRVYTGWIKIPEMPTHLPPFYGLDFGYSTSPDALVEMRFKKMGREGGRLYWKGLMYKTNQGTRTLAKNIKERVKKGAPIYADSQEQRLISDLRDDYGLNIKPCIKGPGSVLAGIEYIKSFQNYYCDNDPNLEFELENYQRETGPDGKPTDEIVDEFNHYMDGGRYAACTHLKKKQLRIHSVEIPA